MCRRRRHEGRRWREPPKASQQTARATKHRSWSLSQPNRQPASVGVDGARSDNDYQIVATSSPHSARIGPNSLFRAQLELEAIIILRRVSTAKRIRPRDKEAPASWMLGSFANDSGATRTKRATERGQSGTGRYWRWRSARHETNRSFASHSEAARQVGTVRCRRT